MKKQRLFRQLDTGTTSKQTRVELLIALACGLTLGVAGADCQPNTALDLTVGVFMTGVVMVASFMGGLPWPDPGGSLPSKQTPEEPAVFGENEQHSVHLPASR